MKRGDGHGTLEAVGRSSGCRRQPAWRALFFQEEARTPGAWKAALFQSIQETAEKSWLPGIAYGGETEKNTSLKEWVVSLASHSMPLGTYVVEHAREDLAAED